MLYKSMFRKFKQMILFSLSVGIGVTAVMTVSTLADYAISTAQGSLDSMGLRGYTVTGTELDNSAYLRLCTAKNIEYASPIILEKATVSTDTVTIIGVDRTIEQMYSLKLKYGEFFSAQNVLNKSSVCVISTNYARHLFSTDNAVNKTFNMTVNGFAASFTVCGVYESDPIVNGYVPEIIDERIYTPYTLLSSLLCTDLNTVAVIPSDNSVATVNAYSHSIFGNSFTVKNIAADRAKIEGMMSTVKTVLSAIGSLTLLVSAISLTVVMIINVRNSRGEIGLKKSVGATDFKILSEVIIQSTVISVVGYILGIFLYFVILVSCNLCEINLVFDIKSSVISFSVVIISSIISGIIPGIIAAKTSPALTLKS